MLLRHRRSSSSSALAAPPLFGPRRSAAYQPPPRRTVSVAAREGVNRGWGGGIYCRLDNLDYQEELLKNWDKCDESLALGDGHFVVINKSGGWWSWDIPDDMHNKVKGRQKSLPCVVYAAIGPDNEYFLQFADGKWKGDVPESLSRRLQAHGKGRVEVLALGPHDGWYLQLQNGRAFSSNVPDSLRHHIVDGDGYLRSDIAKLSLGPNGEWYVKFNDGKGFCNESYCTGCIDAIKQLIEWGHPIEQVEFGENGSWAVVYGPRT